MGKSLIETPAEEKLLTSKEILHSTARMAAYGLHSIISRNNTYQTLEKIMLESQSSLIDIGFKTNMKEILLVKKCQTLSSLIKCSTLPKTSEILTLQEKICERGILIQPCNSHLFYLLGEAQMALFDNNSETDKDIQKLTAAINSYRISISLEGKPFSSKDPPQLLVGQDWWLELNKKEENKKPGKTATQNIKNTRKETNLKEKINKPIITTNKTVKKVPVGNPQKSKQEQKKVTLPGNKKTLPIKEKMTNPLEKTNKSISEKNESKIIAVESDKMETLPLNKTTYHPRLGLARALFKENAHNKETCVLYMDVITINPKLHDAYIELAEILAMNGEEMKSVDIYEKFPFSNCDSSFDDGYIHGEIIRIIMNNEKFDDSRLEYHSIAMGKILGIGSLEKYVNILDSKMKYDILKKIYAGVNNRSIDDPEMQAFFKFKMWL